MANMRSLPLYGRFGLLTFSLCLLCIFTGDLLDSAASAQTPASAVRPAPRIVAPIDASQLVTLKGNVNPRANAQNDRGPVSASLPMAEMVLVLSRSPEDQAAFDAYVAGEYEPSSPDFHQWLTPAQIGQRFGPAESDIAALTNWLASQGFAVTSIAPDRMSIAFSGTAGQAQSAFHTQIHNLLVNGKMHIANMTNPQIPAAFAPVVVGVKGLHNFVPHPLHKMGALVRRDPQTGKWQRVASAASTTSATPSANSAQARPAMSTRLHPEFGINVPANSTEGISAYLEEDVTPYDFATIYNVQSLWTAGINGTGQTIAIAGTTDICLGQSGSPCEGANDVATYRSAFGLPAGQTPKQVNGNSYPPGVCTSSTNACGIGDLQENSLDVEVSGAVAPQAQIVLVASGYNNQTNPTNDPIYDSSYYIVNNINDSTSAVYNAHVMNVSYGLCELYEGTSGNVAYYDLWQTAAAEGLSVFVAAGDSGSPSCDDDGDAYGNPYSAQYGLSVNGVASTPYNTAVGGTDFTWCQPTINSNGNEEGCPSTSSAASPNWNSTNNTTTGESAANYIPEKPWNDTCEDPIWEKYLESIASQYLGGQFGSAGSTPEQACNWVENNWYDIDESYEEETGEPLGLAIFVDTVGGAGGASNCVANNEETDPNNPTCTAGATSTGVTTNPENGASQASLTLVNDGWPKPSWQTGVSGIPSDGVRDLPDVSFFAGDGSLQSATLICVSLDGACVTSSEVGTNPVTTEPTAQEIGGTSVASPEMAGVMALIDEKAGAPQGLANPGLYKLGAMQTWSDCSAASVKNNSSCYFQDVVSGTNTMPCSLGVGGDEGGFVNGYDEPQEAYTGAVSPNCTALTSGDGIGTLVSSGTTPAYNATTGFDLATGLGSLNVANVVNGSVWVAAGTHTATMTVTLSPTGTISYSTALTVSVTVTGSDGTPTGSVVVAGGGYNASQTLDSSGKASITIPAGSLSPGSVTLTVTYGGDTTYASTNQTETVNVSAALPTVTITAPSSGNLNNPISVSVTVSGPSGATTPTGTVTLAQTNTGGTYSSTAANLSSGVATFTIPADTLTAGTDTLKATYSGDSNYTTATGTATIVITGVALLTPTVTVTPTTKSIDSSQSLTLSVKVTGTGVTPSGTVTLTAPSLTPAPSATLDASGSAVLTVPGGTLSSGTPTITVSYSGDAVYSQGTGNASAVTVTQSTYALTAGTVSPSSVTPGSSATVTITGSTSSTDYTGTVSFSSANACTLTTQPSNDNTSALPSCSISGSITYQNGAASGSATATVSTIASTTSALAYPKLRNGKTWMSMGGGAVLAFLVFLGIPARRRSWRAMLGLVVLIAALGSLSACGGGGGGTTTIPGTSAGNYTFTVTGTGNDTANTAGNTTFTITVN